MRTMVCVLVCAALAYAEGVYVDIPEDNPARPAVDSLQATSRAKDSVIRAQCVQFAAKLKGKLKSRLNLDTASYTTCGEYFLLAMKGKKLDTASVLGYYVLYKEVLQNNESLYTTMKNALDEYDNSRMFLTAKVREIREKLGYAQTVISRLSAAGPPKVERGK